VPKIAVGQENQSLASCHRTSKLALFIAPIVKRPGLFYDARDNGHMTERLRFYTAVLQDHLQRHRQMALISGPRQVGKTTVCRALSDAYPPWERVSP
jgi:hypothetical protein